MRGLVVTGTDTDVGKTYITSLLARQLREEHQTVGVYKPVCSGSADHGGEPRWADIDLLAEATGHAFPENRICPQRFHAPLAPNVAARAESRTVNEDALFDGVDWWQDQVDHLLVEGVGGILCPLTDDLQVVNFAFRLRYPVLIVARLGLGTLNHTLMTIECARSRGLYVVGIVLNETTPSENDPSTSSNPSELARLTSVPVLGVCQFNDRELRLSRGGETMRVRDLFDA